jgi:hypothetical protein
MKQRIFSFHLPLLPPPFLKVIIIAKTDKIIATKPNDNANVLVELTEEATDDDKLWNGY